MQIIEEYEALPVHEPLIVLYGPPGSCKTSLAYTSYNPTLLDFDQGANRAVLRKRTVRFEKWQEVMEFMADNGPITQFAPGTLIIDTAGAMLDELVSEFAIRQNGRNGKPGGGVSLQGFGAVKDIFTAFLRRCRSTGVLPVFICHSVEKQDGDNTRLRPKLTGGSYDILIGKADLVGYVEMKQGRAVINFNPTDRHVGKNCVEFPELQVPHYESAEYPGFFQRIIDRTRERMTAMTEAQRQALEQVKATLDEITSATDFPTLADVNTRIEQLPAVYQVQVRPAFATQFAGVWKEVHLLDVTTAEQLTALAAQAKQLEESLRRPIGKLLKETADALHLVYSRPDGMYVSREEPEPEPAEPAAAEDDELTAYLQQQVAPPVTSPAPRPATTDPQKKYAPPPGTQGKLLEVPVKPAPSEYPV